MRTAVYAGTFDPATKGHQWMIAEGASLFDRLLVAVTPNPDKRPFFSIEERLDLLAELTSELPNVRVTQADQRYLVSYAIANDAAYLLRGIRVASDFEYERVLRHVNSDIEPQVQTVFLMPPREIAEVSSSLVKGMVGFDGWETTIAKYVSPAVRDAFLRKVASRG